MPAVFTQVEIFLLTFCPSASPLLLALSGGPDSLYLFYALLAFRKRHGKSFHIAHVDHRWREESQQEAEILCQLALKYQVPFHIKTLDPSQLMGNLEAACREERYAFFAELCSQTSFQGVVTGHHQDDQAETIFKRILEGAHWSRWRGLQLESWIKGIRILRPLLGMTKKEIQQALVKENIEPFEDPSNRNLQFLRARLRESLFPRLNQEFGKQVQSSLIAIGKEAQELTDYFDTRLLPLMKKSCQGPLGIYLDLQASMPENQIEIKYLLRLLCRQQHFFLSRDMIEQAAEALQLGTANQLFAMGTHHIWIDRQRIFLLPTGQMYRLDHWKLKMMETVYSAQKSTTSWKEGWEGHLECYLPIGEYKIGSKDSLNQEFVNNRAIKKRWNQAKIPAFLYSHFPLVWRNEEIYHEFLTGKPLLTLNEGDPCLKIELNYLY